MKINLNKHITNYIKQFTFLVLFLIYSSLSVFATTQKTNITLDLKNTTLEYALEAVKAQSGFSIWYRNEEVNLDQKVSIQVKDMDINYVMNKLLANQDLSYAIEGEYIVIFNKSKENNKSLKSNKIVIGTIFDENGVPVIGANVVEKGTQNGTITDINGNFSLEVFNENAIIEVSYIGYSKQQISVKNRSAISVTLQENTQLLSEIVVVAYGVQKRSTMTGAVADVKGGELSKAIAPNISGSLAGKISGISMRPSSGKPGEDNPNIYIRGIGTTGKQSPLIVVDGVIRDNINQIDPESIESVSVLKDAAAIAPYGLGGANGVILITTKRGKEGKPSLQLNTYYGWQSPTVYPDMVNAQEYMTLRNEAYLNDNNGTIPSGGALPFSQDLINNYPSLHVQDPDKYPDSNYYDDIVNLNTPIQSYNLQLSGGSKQVNYYLGLAYFDQAGMFDNIYYKRYSLNAKMDMQATKYTTIGLLFNGSVERNNVNPAPFSIGYMPIRSLYYSNGFWGESNGSNPIGELKSGSYDKRENNTLLSTLSIEQELPFIPGLSLKGVFSYDPNFAYEKTWQKPSYYYLMDETTTPYGFTKTVSGEDITSLNQRSTKNERMTGQAYLNYAQTFGKHSVTGLAVFEARDTKWNSFYAYRKDYQVNLDELDMGSSDKNNFDNGGSSSQTTQAGIVYRATYGYAGKYLLEASGRYDGHSYFAPGKRWAFFPAFSAGWRISEERFFSENIHWIDNMKLRASWGESGNLAGSAFQYLSAYSLFNNAYVFGNNLTQGSRMTVEANRNITWEKAQSTDIGLDMSFFNSILTLEIDYFHQKRNGMLLSPNIIIPKEYGLDLALENAGEMTNRGFDFQIGSNHSFTNGLHLQISGNFSYAKNRMDKIYESLDTYNSENRRRTGRPWRTPFGYKALGLFSTADDKNGDGIINASDDYNINQFGAVLHPGDVKYADISGPDGIPDGKIDAWDETVVGYAPYPQFTYGFTAAAQWKGFDLSLFFQGSGNASLNIQGYQTIPFRLNNTNVSYEFYDNYWKTDRQNAKYPRITQSPYKNNTTNTVDENGFGSSSNSFWMHKTDYLRLKNFVLGYTIPASITRKAGINCLRLYISGQNVLTFSNLKFMDPEVDYNSREEAYPLQKVWNFGLNLTF